MGTHKSGESVVSNNDENEQFSGIPLFHVLRKIPEYAGTTSVNKLYGPDLPFLFKILSIEQPLSIQSHPDKQLAAKLHQSDPSNYPDDNHKPEMAIALTPFEALCSFRPHQELTQMLVDLEPLRNVIGRAVVDEYLSASPDQKKESLRNCFTQLVKAQTETAIPAINQLKVHLNNKKDTNTLSELESNLLKVLNITSSFYPEDVGCLCALFLNYIQLKPGQAVFLKANEPHCYLSGDCVECMAKSDNVIRLGLTPKYRDIDSICTTLSYEPVNPEEIILQPKCNSNDKVTSIYPSFVDEFVVERISFNSDGGISQEFKLKPKSSASILLVLKGKFVSKSGKIIAEPGCVYFIPAMLPVTIMSLDSQLLCFRAAVNI